MRRSLARRPLSLGLVLGAALCIAVSMGGVGVADDPGEGRAAGGGAVHSTPAPEAPAGRPAPASGPRRQGVAAPPSPLEGLDPMVHRLEDGRLVSDLPDGRKAWLSLDPELQAHVERIFERYEVPFAALVAIEPATGRVLAYVSHSSANPDAGDLARDPTPPTASVFKVVTAAALLDAGVSSGTRVCYGGGLSRLRPADLQDDPARDTRCATFAEAIGRSINSVIAKLADRHLDAPTLERYAAAFGFGQRLPFDLPTRPSPAEVPAERLERARTAAGFWHMHMSPLHGALIAATVANGGQMPRASMVDRLEDRSGRVLLRHEPSSFRSVIPRSTARHLSEMMELTVSQGTARRSFFDAQGNAFLPGIRVAGKTGSLSAERPYRGYSWWVGHAPADHPQIALAALVVNSPEWRIKSSYAAREALREYLVERPRRQAREAAQTREAAAAAAPAP